MYRLCLNALLVYRRSRSTSREASSVCPVNSIIIYASYWIDNIEVEDFASRTHIA